MSSPAAQQIQRKPGASSSAASPSAQVGGGRTKQAVAGLQGYAAQSAALAPDENVQLRTRGPVQMDEASGAAAPTADVGGAAPVAEQGGAPAAEGAAAAPEAPKSSVGDSAVSAAKSMIGTVKAKEITDKDDEGKPARHGWRNLKAIWDGAYPGYANQDLIRHPIAGKKAVGKNEDGSWKMEHSNDLLPSWCGIFAIWAAKQGGSPVGTWSAGVSASTLLPPAQVPKPGDIVVKSKNNHHAMISSVEPDAAAKVAAGKRDAINITTVDGNSGSDPTSGGEIVDKGGSTLGSWNWGVFDIEKKAEPKKGGKK